LTQDKEESAKSVQIVLSRLASHAAENLLGDTTKARAALNEDLGKLDHSIADEDYYELNKSIKNNYIGILLNLQKATRVKFFDEQNKLLKQGLKCPVSLGE
jgi:hypothetical protein